MCDCLQYSVVDSKITYKQQEIGPQSKVITAMATEWKNGHSLPSARTPHRMSPSQVCPKFSMDLDTQIPKNTFLNAAFSGIYIENHHSCITESQHSNFNKTKGRRITQCEETSTILIMDVHLTPTFYSAVRRVIQQVLRAQITQPGNSRN